MTDTSGPIDYKQKCQQLEKALEIYRRDYELQTNQMTTAVNRSWSKDELIEAARNYMLEQYGIPREMIDQENKDRWRERLGLLVDFVNVLWDDPT